MQLFTRIIIKNQLTAIYSLFFCVALDFKRRNVIEISHFLSL